MPSLSDLLTRRNLRAIAGDSIYTRGLHYHRVGRVHIEYADEMEASCTVRGSDLYRVRLWVSSDDFGISCSCPYSARGWFCKHVIAAGLAVADYLEIYGGSAWKASLDALVTDTGKARRTPAQKYWLFISLQPMDDDWKLVPYRFWVSQVTEGVLPEDPLRLAEQFAGLVQHNPWLSGHIKSASGKISPVNGINVNDTAAAFASLLIRQNRQAEPDGYRYYYYSPPSKDPYNVGLLLPVLAGTGLPLYLGDYQNPARWRIHIHEQPVALRFAMRRTEQGLRLSASLGGSGDSLRLSPDPDDIQVVAESPSAWVLAGRHLFVLQNEVNFNVLMPWLYRPVLEIPAEDEDEFLETYFPQLAKRVPVDAPDVTWEDVHAEPVRRLYLTEEDDELLVQLRFGYGDYEVKYEKALPAVSVRRKPETWTLVRIHRDPEAEQAIWGAVSSAYHGLKRGGANRDPSIFLLRARVHPIDFLMRHVPRLAEAGFEIYGEEKLKSARVNRSRPTLSLNVSSGIDWFDLQAVVKFGDVEASLAEVRRAIKRKERYVKLADGTIGEIPEAWIERYRHLFSLGEQTDEGVRLENYHLALVDQLLAEADRAQADSEFQRRKERLLDFKGIQPIELPAGFQGELRPYQKAGFDWLHFLHEYEFGGCLADDMGLGKTIETLAFLQSLKERGEARAANLLVLPRSLLVNWQREAERFTPGLTVYLHFGNQRTDDVTAFDDYDLILTTYGVMLRDIEMLRAYRFHYVILDESQAIKNPLAKTSKAARLLNADHRLVLTGTPVENTTFELWSQFAFLNPGLLGNLEYFKQEFGNPIERRGDEHASEFLRKMVYPFILRRTKSQVAPELPPRTERVIYADMEPAQRNLYNKTRDYYRAMLLGVIEEEGMNNARMKVLEGLLRLRQISNHPKLYKERFRGDSGKFQLLLNTLETLRSEGHKALVFSQFVQMLKLVRAELDARKISYVYLDGRTRKRQQRVDTFQEDPDIPFFLISLKAGGVGLNLTAADYVIHIDPWWNPAVEMQATDRTHRIGQDKPVFVYKLITRNSVEEKILKLQEKKKALVEQLITTESSFFKSLTADDVRVLFS